MTRLMPFGKFAGRPIQLVPGGYLRWLAKQGNLFGQLKQDVERSIAKLPLLPTDADLEKQAQLIVEGDHAYQDREAP